jgi:DNA ligase (NAD+)
MTFNDAYVTALAARIAAARIAYYGGSPTISDGAFDALEDELRKAAPNHTVLKQVGSPLSGGWPKVRHTVPMGSLNKAQTAEDLEKWWRTWCQPEERVSVLVTEKLDGISILLHYDKGVLTGAVTRGDGRIGEDITSNVRQMKGLPTRSELQEFSGHVRGEIVCLKETWADHFPGDSNPRNTASGVAKRQQDSSQCQHLTVAAFSVFSDSHDFDSRVDELNLLDTLRFITPYYTVLSDEASMEEFYQEYIASRREAAPYEIDGLVVAVNDSQRWEELGSASDRPNGSIAYKFPHEAASTVLRNIRWQVGSSGRVTPVAEFHPVLLAGAQVQQASLHTLGNIRDLTGGGPLRTGALILVSRRNDVIPYVEELLNLGEGGALVEPVACPVCAMQLVKNGEYILCPNTTGCSAQTVGVLRNWLKKTGALHFGEALLEAVVEAGWVKTIPDLYRLEVSKVALLDLDGRRVGGAAKRALDSLHSRKTLPLDVFVGSLSIPLCGRRMVALLMEGGLTDMNALSSASVYQLEKIPGFGGTKAVGFRQGFDARKEMILELYGLGLTAEAYTPPSATGPLAGISVCFTGIRDKTLEAAIVAAGGTLKSGVSGSLNILVTKNPTSISGKAKKARDLGVEVISLDEMRGRAACS